MPDIASLLVFPFMLLLSRFGACFMIFPGISDLSVNVRTRLLLAFFVSLALFPLLEPTMPLLPDKVSTLVGYIFVELVIGIMMGVSARIFSSAMHFAGEIIGFSIGLQASTLFDPTSGSQSTAPALFLGMVGTVLIFALNMHHVIIQALADSYNYFPSGTLPDLGDAAQAVTTVVQDVFVIGVKLSAPIMTVGFLIYVGFGIFNRLIPQLQVFFVALPLTITVGIFMLGVSLGGMVLLYSSELLEHAVLFTQEG